MPLPRWTGISRVCWGALFLIHHPPDSIPRLTCEPATGWIPNIWTQVMGWTEPEIAPYVAHLRRECRDLGVHAYSIVRVVCGRKPGLDDAPATIATTTTSSSSCPAGSSWRGCRARASRVCCWRVRK